MTFKYVDSIFIIFFIIIDFVLLQSVGSHNMKSLDMYVVLKTVYLNTVTTTCGYETHQVCPELFFTD